MVVPIVNGSVNGKLSDLVTTIGPGIGQLSVAVATGNTKTVSQFTPASTTISAGHVIIGASSSITVTTVLHVSMFPPQSVTVYISLFGPFG